VELFYIYGNLKNNLQIKKHLFDTDGPFCVYCHRGFTMYKDRELTIDHVIPRKYGGSNRLHNLVLSCENCNKNKDSKGGTNLQDLINCLLQHRRLREILSKITFETIPSRVLVRLPKEVKDHYINYKTFQGR